MSRKGGHVLLCSPAPKIPGLGVVGACCMDRTATSLMLIASCWSVSGALGSVGALLGL